MSLQQVQTVLSLKSSDLADTNDPPQVLAASKNLQRASGKPQKENQNPKILE